MNQYRYLVEDVKDALSDADKVEAHAIIEQSKAALSHFSDAKIQFLQNKATLAAETMSFYIKQQYRFHEQGYPCQEVAYLSVLEKKLTLSLAVFIALYRINPAFLYTIYDEFPDVLAWLCLNEAFAVEDEKMPIIGLSLIDTLDKKLITGLLLRSNSIALDKVMARLVEGKSAASELYVHCLTLRQRISISLVKHWISMSFLPALDLHTQLALSNVTNSIEWLNEREPSDAILFTQLVLKEDRATWFRQQYSPESPPSEEATMYAKLLGLKEFSEFDIEHRDAPFHFMLSGDTSLTPSIVSCINTLDERQGVIWCEALQVVYGDSFPFLPSKIDINIEWHDVLVILNKWIDNKQFKSNTTLRFGQALSFDASIEALKSADINANFRIWLWRELCVLSRVHFHWHPQLSAQQQFRLLNSISQIALVRERFNLRGKHAALGY